MTDVILPFRNRGESEWNLISKGIRLSIHIHRNEHWVSYLLRGINVVKCCEASPLKDCTGIKGVLGFLILKSAQKTLY